MFYTIYKITNNLDGKYYIGKHQTKDLDDGYMGSGKLLKRATKKHGIENFTKEILHVFDNEQEMNDKEKELVILSEESYNLCEGGKGGFGYINSNGLTHHNYEIGSQYSKIGNLKKTEMFHKDQSFRENYSKSLSDSKKGDKNPRGFLGKQHTVESKNKQSEKMKNRVPWNKGKAWKDWHPASKV